ncbi:MAG: response regulator [Chitinivibrionales bacterium]|nr:response regulator [Chitinivibrionales bacterium]
MEQTARRFPPARIMIVDDEEHFLRSARVVLAGVGIDNVDLVADSREVLPRLAQGGYGIVTLDITMPVIAGTELLASITLEHPDVLVIMVTGHNDVETAVDCMRNGAFDYAVKPLSEGKLVTCMRRAIEHRSVRDEASRLKRYVLSDLLQCPEAFERIVTRSPAMHSAFLYAEAIAPTELPVLITGETGVGKELMAQAIHRASGRGGDFVPVNIAGLDDTMVADTLYGHVKGAFTGADSARQGLIESAAGGTLFLDEIGDLRGECQIKLLRLLQEGQYYPLGSDTPRVSHARIVAATNRQLEATPGFRKDLYYRLQAHQLHIPPLRVRKEDLGLLARTFIERAAAKLNKPVSAVPRELDLLLAAYEFPGNVRELEGMVFDTVTRHRSGVLSLEPIRARIQAQIGHSPSVPSVTEGALSFPTQLPTLKEVEDLLIREALDRTEGNKSLAALMLGITRQTLANRLKSSADGNGEGGGG